MPGWDETENQWRYRIRDPNQFVDDSMRTITLTTGVQKIIGKLKSDPNGSTVGQALHFNKETFKTQAEAKKWKEDHPNAAKDISDYASKKILVNI